MEEREEWGGRWGGERGNYTQADSICFSSVLKHPPPIRALLFSSCSFPIYKGTDARSEEPYLSHTLLTLKAHTVLSLSSVCCCILTQHRVVTCATGSEMCCSLL